MAGGGIALFRRDAFARICFDIDGLQRVLKVDIFEDDILNAVVVRVGRHRANRSANSKCDIHVTNSESLSAMILRVATLVAVAWLWDDCVVIVLDARVLNQDVRAANVNRIGV